MSDESKAAGFQFIIHHSSFIILILFLLRRAGERRDIAAEEGLVYFVRAVEVALVNQDERAGRGRREQGRERVGAARLDGGANPVLPEDVGDHLGLGGRADVVQRDEARLAVVALGILRRELRDQLRPVVGAARDPLLVLRLADRTEHFRSPVINLIRKSAGREDYTAKRVRSLKS